MKEMRKGNDKNIRMMETGTRRMKNKKGRNKEEESE